MLHTTRVSRIRSPVDDVEGYVIDELAHLETLVTIYPDPDPAPIGAGVDWEAVARDYNAVHLIGNGQQATRFTRPTLWNCESTLWTDWWFKDSRATEIDVTIE